MSGILSPMRYPGAKNKLAPFILEKLNLDQQQFADVFVGGGSILLSVAELKPNIKLLANDKDVWIFSFWKIIAEENEETLTKLLNLIDQKPTIDLFYSLRESKSNDIVDLAYKAIFFNRTCFSGILKSDPIGGKEQNSKYKIDCRYNAKKIKEKILKCRELLFGRTKIYNLDFSDFISQIDCPMYIDPPYYKAGKSLYIEYMNDYQHKQLSDLLQSKSDWVLSYDDCIEIKNLYSSNTILNLKTDYCISGKKETWNSKNELLIIK